MMSFNDFLGSDGVCSIPVVNGVVNIVKRGGVVDSIPFASASPRDIVRLMVAWSFTSDFCVRVEFVCGSSLLAYLDDSSLWRPVWLVSLPES